ncbi:C1 family peptidase [Planctomycetota bacterium]
MRFSGHTPLSKMSVEKVSSQQQVLLSALWVESVEEFTAMMAAIESAETSIESSVINPLMQCKSVLLENIPEEEVAPWHEARPGGALGCQLKPDVLEMYKQTGLLSIPGSTVAQLSGKPLPPSVRLMNELFPVRDQGHRGTCVAFASVGLREYLERCSSELSEQFLYWACKQLDGFPNEAGTFIHTAMSALSTKGVCERTTWPYNPEEDPGNESQAPPPDGAEEHALSFVMPNTRAVAQTNINSYKQLLAGADGYGPMPVVIASLVFNSWFRSAATNQTGKITMPLPGEMPLPGGHAMLIVGYQDDSSVPGGGYFIVRNSWSPKWAALSPEAPGHAMMPYAYVERYIVEAFSGQAVSQVNQEIAGDSPSECQTRPKSPQEALDERYIYTLRQDKRDMEGKLLRAGTSVIHNPKAPDEIMEDTGTHRRRFIENGYGWSDTIRQTSWFPPLDTYDSTLATAISQARARCQEFTGAIDENLMSCVGHAIPDINLSPLLYMLAWMPKVRKVECVADLTDQLVTGLCRLGQVPVGIAPTPEWQDVLNHCNQLKLYQVRSHVGNFLVVTCFITPIGFSATNTATISPAGPEGIDLVQSIIQEHQSQYPQIKFTFYALSCAQSWTSSARSISSSQSLILLSEQMDDQQWHTQSPPRFAASVYLRNFIERLHPETQQRKVSRIKAAVDLYIDKGYEGNILLEKIAAQTGYRRSVIKEAFKAMQRSGHYEAYPVGKDLAIRSVQERKAKTLRIETEACFLRYHGGILIGAFLSVLFWRLGDTFGPKRLGFISIIVAAIFVYIGKWLEIIIQRKSID